MKTRASTATCFLDACDEAGYQRNDDFNGAQIEGAGIYDVNTHKGQRASSNVAYLEPALKRSNLQSNITRWRPACCSTARRATGVEVTQNGVTRHSRGARSASVRGRGRYAEAAATLRHRRRNCSRARDPVVHELPAVGRNLQDHLCVSYYYRANMPTLNDDFGRFSAS